MLRTRLVLGLLCLLVILLAMGLYSIDRCSKLGERVQMVLDENYQLIRSMQDIKKVTNNATTALLLARERDQPPSRSDFLEACDQLGKAIEGQHEKALSPRSKELASALLKAFKSYRKDGTELVQLQSSQKLTQRTLLGKMEEDTARIMRISDLILEANQETIQERNTKTGEETNTTIRLMILSMISAVVVAIYASFRLSKGLLTPLESLTQSIKEVGEGNLDLRLKAGSKDELGILAHTFNKMSEQLKEYRETSSGKLSQLNRTIQQTIASFPDPIFVLSSSGTVEFRNPSADALAIQLMFAGVSRLPEKVESLVGEVMASGKDHLPTLLKDAICFKFENQDHYYMPRIVILRQELEKSFGVAIILEEITQALLLDQVKTNLVSTVSHELKTPLTSIRMVLYLLLEQSIGTVNEQQKNLLSTAREDTDRLLRTLNDLLDLTRLEEGPPQMNLETVTPRDLLQMSIEHAQERASAAGHRLTLLVEDGLPNVSVDRQRIAYVFDNLMTNAVKYSAPETGIEIQACSAGPDHVRFSIRDQGPGIPQEYAEKIFDKFFRIPGTLKMGTGLGLSIAREIVLANKGTIGVISQENKGSEFYVILPAAKESNGEKKG